MKGLKLLRRMEAADLIRWFPEDGRPVVVLEGGAFRRCYTQPVYLNDGYSLWMFDAPDDPLPTMGTNLKALDLFARMMQ